MWLLPRPFRPATAIRSRLFAPTTFPDARVPVISNEEPATAAPCRKLRREIARMRSLRAGWGFARGKLAERQTTDANDLTTLDANSTASGTVQRAPLRVWDRKTTGKLKTPIVPAKRFSRTISVARRGRVSRRRAAPARP